MMRQLYLGRCPRDEVHQGFSGNSMLIAQPTAQSSQVMPDMANVQQNLTLLFCKSPEDVSRAHALVVKRDLYIQCMEHRIAVCPVFQDVELNRQASHHDLPDDAVPPAFVEGTRAMPEIAQLRTKNAPIYNI